jgi:hypothetical protein
MTENEAIEELKFDCNELGKAIPCDTSWGESFENAYAMAINALKEIQQYRAIGTPEECQAAMEKQIPYKLSRKKLVWGVGKCKCGVEFLDRQTGFCGNCGQKLDWEGER